MRIIIHHVGRILIIRISLVCAIAGALLAGSSLAFAHGGGLDDLGRHNDRKAGQYHCHRGPLKGGAYDSKSEAKRDLVSVDQAPGGDDRVKETKAVKGDTAAVDIPGVRKWFLRSERSRFDGSQIVYAAPFAEDTVLDSHGLAYTPIIAVRCREGETSFFLTYGSLYLGLYTNDVQYKVSGGKAEIESWNISTNSYAIGLWKGRRARTFVKSLFNKPSFIFRMIPAGENVVTSTFDISGIKDAVKPVRKTCGW